VKISRFTRVRAFKPVIHHASLESRQMLSLPNLPLPPVVSQWWDTGKQWVEAGGPVVASFAYYGAYAYVTAAGIMASRFPNTQSLPALDQEVLRPIFGDLVDQVSINYGASPVDSIDSGGEAYDLQDSLAQTFGNRIYIQSSYAAMSDEERPETEIHEMTHVQQYVDFGSTLFAMGYNYMQDFAEGGFNYYNNSLEQQAYANQYNLINSVYGLYEAVANPMPLCLVGVDGSLEIDNTSTINLAFSFRWSSSDSWANYMLNPGHNLVFYIYNDCGQIQRSPEITFDDNVDPGYQAKTYALSYSNNPTPNDPSAPNAFPEATLFEFQDVPRTAASDADIDLFNATGVSSTPQAPVQAPLGNQTVSAGSTLSLADYAADPNVVEIGSAVDPLVYSLPTAPAGATINPATGAINWSPDTSLPAGDYQLTVRVSKRDEPQLFSTDTVTIDVLSRPPSVIAAQLLDKTVLNRLGKHVTMTNRFIGFELTFSEAIDSASAQNAGNYQLFQVVKRGRKTLHTPVGFQVSYNSANHKVNLVLAGKPAFKNGGGLLLVPSGITDTSGESLVGQSTFTILAHARGITEG
jgi:hypothetical protein